MEFKKLFLFVFALLILLFNFYSVGLANNLQISNAVVLLPNTSSHYRLVQFDISWENSWRTTNAPYNWDAAWVFVKYKVGSGDWQHAMLSTNAGEHVAPSGSTINPPSDGKGVFIYRSSNGTGTFNLIGVQLRWNYGSDGVSDGDNISLKVFGIEMVYIPQGSFYAGDRASRGTFKSGSNDSNPWNITSEDAINVTNAVSGGYYYNNQSYSGTDDPTGSSFIIPASFPKGYRAIYCMKYEITQGQYADFLNMLTSLQASNQYPTYRSYRFTISVSGGVYSASRPNRGCGSLTCLNSMAYADWSALRPMTELEFEKICRGSGQPSVGGEHAGGTTNRIQATTISGTEDGTETITNSGANYCWGYNNFSGGDADAGPLRAGIFAKAGTTRDQSGASFYGAMEMSGNLNEACITVGNSSGRSFDGSNGDGKLNTTGYADVLNWPGTNGVGFGCRGGGWYNEGFGTEVSGRALASTPNGSWTIAYVGFRGVRFVP